MTDLSKLNVEIYADGADLISIAAMAQKDFIKGFTTNPTLMRKAGVTDYVEFAFEMLRIVPARPVCFEVFADDFDEMERQAHEIASWGRNVFVKIPVTNTAGEFAGPLIERLALSGVQLNVTAMMMVEQVAAVAERLAADVPAIVSVFAGRIADTGRDPVPMMKRAVEILQRRPLAKLLWASPRELLNLFHADQVGCHIITATDDVLRKISLLGKDLDGYSLETVEMFYRDAAAAGYKIALTRTAATGS
jgi:transaldolase